MIPILEREFDDFDTEAGKFMRGETAEDQFIGFRLKQGVYGQRQPDVQMIRVKLPLGGITPEQMDAFAEAIERWAPLRKGHITTRENIQIHHIPLPDAAKFIRLISDAGLSSREGCGNTVRNVTGDPWAGITEGELFDITPYAMAYVRYFVRHPTTQLMPRKVKTAFTATDEDVAMTGIHDIGFIPQLRDGVRGVEIRVGGGTSIMPRIAPTLYEFVELDNGDYLKIAEACWRIFDRQEWLRVNRARARIKVLVDKVGIDAFREMVEEELEGDWVAERDFDVERLKLIDDEEANAPPPPAGPRSPNGDRSEFDRFAEANVRPQRQQGFSAVEVKVTRGDLTPEQLRGLAADHARVHGRLRADLGAAELRPALGPRRVRSTTSGSGSASSGLGDAGAPRDHRRGQLPGHRQLQARDHQLDGAQQGGPGAARGDGDHRSADPRDPHQDERLPERLLPAPHREHRLLRRLDQGRRPRDPRLHRAPRRQLRERRDRLRPPAEGAPAGQARARGGRALGALLRGRARRRRGVQRLRRAGRHRIASRSEVKDLAMPVEFSLETLNQFIDWSRSDPYKVERGEGECAV